MTFKIRNYTTGISADKSIGEIERMLADFGASHIMKEYAGDGTVRSLAFRLTEKSYKLPCNREGVFQVMFGDKRYSGRKNATKNREVQSLNTSWRLLHDWIHAQLSIVKSGQAKVDEVMLPYMWDGKRTLYESYKTGRLEIENKTDDGSR
jgi:hypothetical protein